MFWEIGSLLRLLFNASARSNRAGRTTSLHPDTIVLPLCTTPAEYGTSRKNIHSREPWANALTHLLWKYGNGTYLAMLW
jgi:hypothetical protein